MCVDYTELKSYNKDLYVLMSSDDGDLSYGWKLHVALHDFMEKGYKFIFLKRFKYQSKLITDWWGDLAESYEKCYGEKVELSQDGCDLFVNGNHAGKILTLSDPLNVKEVEWSNYRNIGFDEFVEPIKYNYASGNEPEDYFWPLVSSVFRYIPEDLSDQLSKYKTTNINGRDEIKHLPKYLNDKLKKHHKTMKVYLWSSIVDKSNPYLHSLAKSTELDEKGFEDVSGYSDESLYFEIF